MQRNKNTSLFTHTNDVPCQYPWLSFNEECDALVIGGGITGCITAYKLATAGISTILISKRPIGYTSSLINSYMLCYQNELMLTDLSKDMGTEKAVTCFKLCQDKLDELEDLSTKIDDFRFRRRDGFLYTENVEQINKLHAEYLMRKHNQFDVKFLEKQDAREMFSFHVEAGILSKNMAGEVDGYLLCHALLKAGEKYGLRVYENTMAVDIYNVNGKPLITTDNQKQIKAKKVIMATGPKQDDYFNIPIVRKTTFTMATAPVSSFQGYESKAIVKNMTKNIYLRTTADHRIIIGGLDCTMFDKEGRLSKILKPERLHEKKYDQLETELNKMLCGITPLKVEYDHAGCYADTKDHLPIVGKTNDYPNVFFHMTSSINGVLYSLIGADIIVSLYKCENVDNIFSPDRCFK